MKERKKQDKKLLEEYFSSLGKSGYKIFVKKFTAHIKDTGNLYERKKVDENFNSPLFSAKKLDYAKLCDPKFFK